MYCGKKKVASVRASRASTTVPDTHVVNVVRYNIARIVVVCNRQLDPSFILGLNLGKGCNAPKSMVSFYQCSSLNVNNVIANY
jgi:hypothetical protein